MTKIVVSQSDEEKTTFVVEMPSEEAGELIEKIADKIIFT
jgi:hypothetical protein